MPYGRGGFDWERKASRRRERTCRGCAFDATIDRRLGLGRQTTAVLGADRSRKSGFATEPRDPAFDALVASCVLVDLEIEGDRIRDVGALRGERVFRLPNPDSSGDAVDRLGEFARGARFVVGHNLVAHDRRFIEMHRPGAELLRLPVVDTLYLAPLAFPQRPYHPLVKDYKLAGERSDPVEDCRLALEVLGECWRELGKRERERRGLVSIYRSCFDDSDAPGGTSPLRLNGAGQALEALGAQRLPRERLLRGFEHFASDRACMRAVRRELPALLDDPTSRPAAAYALAWLTVRGTESVLSRWVHRSFPGTSRFLQAIRSVDCGDTECAYCRKQHDPVGKLEEYFGHRSFRARPATSDGESLQARIVERGLAGGPLLAIMPTGGGKSLCYQLPAIVRNERTGALTVVISPLQALMKDQVENLNRQIRGGRLAAALNGLLTLPERHDVLEGIKLGRFAMLYVSPEQLRNGSFEAAVRQREIAAWVFDEAHCIAKWGHDFRPDYLYAARFIREFSAREGVETAPVACFTATARVDVREEIVAHFREELGQEVEVLAADRVDRSNLRYAVEEVVEAQKERRIVELLERTLGSPAAPRGAAIVYARSRRRAENLATALRGQAWPAEHFHAGVEAPDKKRVQEGFIAGDVPVIVATNAFGMGIDKSDVRLVVHADVPGSIESYLQEAGRAGRDGEPAHCVLLFAKGDLERQFDLESENRISQRDIGQILKAIRGARRRDESEVVLSPGEILRVPETEVSFDGDDRSAATKVKTAIAWLERARFLLRDENRTNVFQGVSAVRDLDAARQRIEGLDLSPSKRRRWLEVLRALHTADLREGLDADGLAHLPAFSSMVSRVGDDAERDRTATREVLRALHEMTDAGLLEKGIYFTAWVRRGTRDPSAAHFARVVRAERAMAKVLQEADPDAAAGVEVELRVDHLAERLREEDVKITRDALLTLLRGWTREGVDGRAALRLRGGGRRHLDVALLVEWAQLREQLEVRAQIGQAVVEVFVEGARRLGAGERLVRFSLADLQRGLDGTLGLAERLRDPFDALEKALLFLDENGIVKLEKGLAVFRQAMRIRVLDEARGRRYAGPDYRPLEQHYDERGFQIHAMGRYVAEAGRDAADAGGSYVRDYFGMASAEFRRRYFAEERGAVRRATSRELYAAIVEDLRNPAQEAIVTAPSDVNMLVLAGPGSGKTRVVVHRCAYLAKVARIRPERILAVCFNRGAMNELRRRLRDLIGAPARRVAVHTYHSLALALTERSMAARAAAAGGEPVDFDGIIEEANRRLRGEEEIVGAAPDELRDRLLAGFEYVLVDEYQDIDGAQYEMIGHIARGRGEDGDERATILAVGDDDQTIYQWRRANVKYLRQFEEEYGAERRYLAENYRSTRNIVEAAEALIARNRDRMKTRHPIRVDARRAGDPPGGDWESLDPEVRGRVSVLDVRSAIEEPRAALAEIERLRGLDPKPDWQNFAVLAWRRSELDAARAVLEHAGVSCRRALPRGKLPPLPRIREFARLLAFLGERYASDVALPALRKRLPAICGCDSMWTAMARRMLVDVEAELEDERCPASQVLESLHRGLADRLRDHLVGDGVLVGTVHAGKGREFGHVLVLGGGWNGRPGDARLDGGEVEEARRLYYVAMTRAKKTLTLVSRRDDPVAFLGEIGRSRLRRRRVGIAKETAGVPATRYATLGKRDLFIDFAGWKAQGDRVHGALAALRAGDAVTLKRHGHGVGAFDRRGVEVGRLSESAAAKWPDRRLSLVEEARVLGLVRREVADCETEAYRERAVVPVWEYPILELCFRA